ncbi:MAG TPA: DUF535 family protein [Ramlibacter sp.]|nr:DUF535 family protein [Ramlibacter sp.]
MPSIWQGIAWALRQGKSGGVSRWRLAWRAFDACLRHRRAMNRWMAVAFEMQARGLADDLPGEYLRAVRPCVHRRTSPSERVVQLTDHFDWLETAFKPAAFERLTSGRPLVLAELPAPRGYAYMRLQLTRTPPSSPEGELLLTLTLQRAADVQKSRPVDAAALAFSRFRIDDSGCLAIGGVRGQRHPVLRISSNELASALSGWKPPVLMVRVAQELARHWGLVLVGLNPGWHPLQGWTYQLSPRNREAAQRLYASYDALWEHFDASKGPPGWMVLPLNSDEQLAATDLSPEKRQRQTQRADYWIRIRNLLRLQLRELLQKPGREAQVSRITQAMPLEVGAPDDAAYFASDEDVVPSRVLATGPGTLT